MWLQSSKRIGKRREPSHSWLRRACVSPVNPQCSGGAASASSMAEPASLPPSAVSVSASHSRHSARKRASPTQPQPRVESKRPRTRSQDTTAASPAESPGGRGKLRPAETPTARTSPRSPRLNRSLENFPTTSRTNNNHNPTISLSTHHRKSQSVGGEEIADTPIKTRRTSKVEAGTSVWEVSTLKSKSKNREASTSSKSPEGDNSGHKYPLRNHVRLSISDSGKTNSPSSRTIAGDSKSPTSHKKKNKVRSFLLFYYNFYLYNN